MGTITLTTENTQPNEQAPFPLAKIQKIKEITIQSERTFLTKAFVLYSDILIKTLCKLPFLSMSFISTFNSEVL